jgi:alpha-glucosidase (family GH31 glycosyl hydrolase)
LLAVFEDLAPNACETRTAWLSQRRSIIWRQGGKDSHWGPDNGLAAMVNLALHMSLLGYDLQIPDMIPGRVQTLTADHPLPTDELMIRWTEATAFMPFSYFPWNYTASTEQILRAYALAHKQLQPYLVEEARGRRVPLLRPIWYDTPGVAELFAVADEFMLGRNLLVAPVLNSNSKFRDVMLPPGEWIDAWTGIAVKEGLQRNYPAPCPGIPLFVRSGCEGLRDLLHKVLSGICRDSVASGITTTKYSAGLNRDISITG